MKHTLLLLALLLAACSAPVTSSSPSMASAPGGDLAGQSVFIQATQVAFAATVAVATAQVKQTEDAANMIGTAGAATATARSDTLNIALTAGAATSTAQSDALNFSRTQNAATVEAQQTAIVITKQAQEAMTAVADKQKGDSFWWWWWVIVMSAGAGIVLYFVAQWGQSLANGQKAKNVRAINVRGGTLIITQNTDGTISQEFIAYQPALPPGTASADDDFDTDAEPSEEIPFYRNGNLKEFFNRQEIDAAHDIDEGNRAFVLKFVRQCMSVNGAGSNRVPGFRQMSIAADTWTRAVKLLGDNITKQPGVGTWLSGDYRTLGEMYQAVGERRYIPRITIDHSPTPATVGSEN